jgi:hypothetical protein
MTFARSWRVAEAGDELRASPASVHVLVAGENGSVELAGNNARNECIAFVSGEDVRWQAGGLAVTECDVSVGERGDFYTATGAAKRRPPIERSEGGFTHAVQIPLVSWTAGVSPF